MSGNIANLGAAFHSNRASCGFTSAILTPGEQPSLQPTRALLETVDSVSSDPTTGTCCATFRVKRADAGSMEAEYGSVAKLFHIREFS